MAIGRITGPMLFGNLERQGVDLAIDGNVVYADVTNRRVGISTNNPQYTLDVNGNAHISNLYILNDTITSSTGAIQLGDIGNVKITGGQPNFILYTDGTGNLNFGTLDTLSGLEGFTGNYIALGTNSVGSLSNALSISTTTTVTDGIALLNQLLGNITNSSGSLIHVSGNITAGNVVSNLYGPLVGNVIGNVVGNITGNITGTNINGTNGNFTNIFGLINTPSQPSITTVGTLGNLTVTNNVATGNILTNNYLWANAVPLAFTYYTNSNVTSYLPTYTGNLYPGNIVSSFYGNVYSDYISPNVATVVTFTGTAAVQLPVGTAGQQPSGVPGYIRYNSTTNVVEFFDGTNWISVVNAVADQTVSPDGVSATYTLLHSTTTIAILVSINGTLQQPTTAYTVAGNQITFAEVPQVTDIIDVRFIASTVTPDISNYIGDTVISGNVTLGGILSAPQTTKASNATGSTGQVCWDANFIYVCTATNTWKRTPLTGGY